MVLLLSDETLPKVLDTQCYMASIVQLLALCSEGDNKTVESICRTMFTLQELLDILRLPNLCHGLRAPFLRFITSVFFASNLQIAEYELIVSTAFHYASNGHMFRRFFPLRARRPPPPPIKRPGLLFGLSYKQKSLIHYKIELKKSQNQIRL